ALHELVGDAPPQHRPGCVHQLREVVVQLVVRDPLAMVAAPVQRHVDSEGQEAHGADVPRRSRRRETSGRWPSADAPQLRDVAGSGIATFRKESRATTLRSVACGMLRDVSLLPHGRAPAHTRAHACARLGPENIPQDPATSRKACRDGHLGCGMWCGMLVEASRTSGTAARNSRELLGAELDNAW